MYLQPEQSMTLNIDSAWSQPVALPLARPGLNLIYDCPRTLDVPTNPGIYIFGRSHGNAVYPLYIGRSLNLNRRLSEHLNSVRLMSQLRNAGTGARFFIWSAPTIKPGQSVERVLRIMEDAIIAQGMSYIRSREHRDQITSLILLSTELRKN